MTAIWMRRVAALAMCALCACGGAATKTAAPVEAVPEPPPQPPRDALAWLTPEASVIARIDLAAFRASPLSKYLPDVDEPSAQWLDLELIDAIHVSFEPHGQQDPSVVGVLEGRFPAAYLKDHGEQLGAATELHGERTVYLHEGTYWVQPRPELLVGCTADRLPWVLERYEAGPDAPLRSAPLYEALAPVVDFDTAHVAVLLQDEDGSARKALKETAQVRISLLERALEHVGRGAVKVQLEDGLAVDVLADTDTPEHAQQLLGLLQGYLERYKNSPLILLLGLRELLAGIQLSAEGSRVSISARVTQAQIDAIVERLEPMFEGMFEPAQPAPAPAPPAQSPAPEPAQSPAPEGGESARAPASPAEEAAGE